MLPPSGFLRHWLYNIKATRHFAILLEQLSTNKVSVLSAEWDISEVNFQSTTGVRGQR